MASITARRNQEKIAECLYKDTHFTKSQVISLLGAFEENAKNERMDRAKFRDILHHNFGLTEDILLDRVFRVFDEDNDGILNMKEWINGLSKILRGTLTEQKDFCFKVYDLNSSGYILREEVHHLLKGCMAKSAITTDEDTEENVKDLVDLTIKKMDADHDGKISLTDYSVSIDQEYILLEVLGKCLPNREEADTFLQKYT